MASKRPNRSGTLSALITILHRFFSNELMFALLWKCSYFRAYLLCCRYNHWFPQVYCNLCILCWCILLDIYPWLSAKRKNPPVFSLGSWFQWLRGTECWLLMILGYGVRTIILFCDLEHKLGNFRSTDIYYVFGPMHFDLTSARTCRLLDCPLLGHNFLQLLLV